MIICIVSGGGGVGGWQPAGSPAGWQRAEVLEQGERSEPVKLLRPGGLAAASGPAGGWPRRRLPGP